MTTTVEPIRDPNRGWREWNITEIYTGPNGTGRYVPNVNDAAWDWAQGKFRVTDVNDSTLLSTLEKYIAPKEPNTVDDSDVLLGAGPGAISESYRAFMDTSVVPHTLALDRRLHLYGSTCTHIKVFLGTNIGVGGDVISLMYDQNGTLLGENIPLELVVMPGALNVAVKAPVVGYSNRSLPDGELVTVVAYDSVGGPVSIERFLVKNTSFIRTTDASRKYIESIHIESPFVSGSANRLIECPINMPVSGLAMMGVVTYSDGSTAKLPIDGSKFSLYGFEGFVSTILGQRLPLVLSYKLSSEEVSYGAIAADGHHISEAYTITSTEADGAYRVKLFAYPVWIDAVNGYKLEYFLANLDRNKIYYVTPYISIANGSAAFDPKRYGVIQRISVGLSMADVNGIFSNYRHTQMIEITLLAPGNENRANWTVGFEADEVPYGAGVKADVQFISQDLWRYDVSAGCASKELWLEKVFYATMPLFDPQTESRAPAPTHFVLVVGSRRVELAISQWNIRSSLSEHVREGECVYLEFFKRTATNDLYLGCTGMITHQLA